MKQRSSRRVARRPQVSWRRVAAALSGPTYGSRILPESPRNSFAPVGRTPSLHPTPTSFLLTALGQRVSAARFVTIRARDYRGGPRSWEDSDFVIGRKSANGKVKWRDDVLGHERFSMGPHVSVEVNGIGFHFFY